MQQSLHKSQAYTSKRRIFIQVLPVPNAYTKSANACIHSLWYSPSQVLTAKHVLYPDRWEVGTWSTLHLASNTLLYAYITEVWLKLKGSPLEVLHFKCPSWRHGYPQLTATIGDRKFLNEYTPFGSVSLWDVLKEEYKELTEFSCMEYEYPGYYNNCPVRGQVK